MQDVFSAATLVIGPQYTPTGTIELLISCTRLHVHLNIKGGVWYTRLGVIKLLTAYAKVIWASASVIVLLYACIKSNYAHYPPLWARLKRLGEYISTGIKLNLPVLPERGCYSDTAQHTRRSIRTYMYYHLLYLLLSKY